MSFAGQREPSLPSRFVSFNVQWGGGDEPTGTSRILAIARALERHEPDVVALTEYVPRISGGIIDRLGEAGYVSQALTTPRHPYGGVAILSRWPLESFVLPSDLTPFAHRVLPVRIPALSTTLVGLYAPYQQPADEFWRVTLTWLATIRDDRVLVMGDLNTGASEVDMRNKAFFCSQHFARFPDAGYSDLWRRQHGSEAREYTWFHETGSGFRIDHALATAAFTDTVGDCRYSHSERDPAVSDHSLMIVDAWCRDD